MNTEWGDMFETPPTADQWRRQYEHMKKDRDHWREMYQASFEEVARLRHLPRALEMANDRAERWRQRYNDATERLPQAWEEGWEAAWTPVSLHHKDQGPNPYRSEK